MSETLPDSLKLKLTDFTPLIGFINYENRNVRFAPDNDIHTDYVWKSNLLFAYNLVVAPMGGALIGTMGTFVKFGLDKFFQ